MESLWERFSAARLCWHLGVARSCFYAWRKRQHNEGPRARDNPSTRSSDPTASGWAGIELRDSCSGLCSRPELCEASDHPAITVARPKATLSLCNRSCRPLYPTAAGLVTSSPSVPRQVGASWLSGLISIASAWSTGREPTMVAPMVLPQKPEPGVGQQ